MTIDRASSLELPPSPRPCENGTMTVKEQLHRIVDELPEEDAIEEMQYRLYVLRKVRRGLAATDDGREIAHEQIVERIEPRFQR